MQLVQGRSQRFALVFRDWFKLLMSGSDRSHAATGAVVRVLIQSTDGHSTWSTVGASSNIIEARWQALADSVEYALLGLNRNEGRVVQSERMLAGTETPA